MSILRKTLRNTQVSECCARAATHSSIQELTNDFITTSFSLPMLSSREKIISRNSCIRIEGILGHRNSSVRCSL